MKKNSAGMLALVALVCIFVIGAVLVQGLMKKKPDLKSLVNLDNTAQVLGEMTKGAVDDAANSAVVSSAKNTITEKLVEVEKTVVKEVEKNVASFTQSQIETVKYNVCKEWGVAVVTPTSKP